MEWIKGTVPRNGKQYLAYTLSLLTYQRRVCLLRWCEDCNEWVDDYGDELDRCTDILKYAEISDPEKEDEE